MASNQVVQIKFSGIDAGISRPEFEKRLSGSDLAGQVSVMQPDDGGAELRSLDPAVIAALIAGGASIIVALIPVLADLWKSKSEKPPQIVIHGTADTMTINVSTTPLSAQNLAAPIAELGTVTRIEVS